LFGSHSRSASDPGLLTRLGLRPGNTPVKKASPETPYIKVKTDQTKATQLSVPGVVSVSAGKVRVGGGETKRPPREIRVEYFMIAVTEVTNREYEEFVLETEYRAPEHWPGGKVTAVIEDLPVVNVSVADAKAFCRWKSEKIGFEVRLPTHAEWQRAAGGKEGFKYPWGNEWKDGVVNRTKLTKPLAVRSFELNRSPDGAFDMIGSVWEWTGEAIPRSDVVTDALRAKMTTNTKVHLVLGGSFTEEREKLVNSFWTELVSTTRNRTVGFRYAIIPTSIGDRSSF